MVETPIYWVAEPFVLTLRDGVAHLEVRSKAAEFHFAMTVEMARVAVEDARNALAG